MLLEFRGRYTYSSYISALKFVCTKKYFFRALQASTAILSQYPDSWSWAQVLYWFYLSVVILRLAVLPVLLQPFVHRFSNNSVYDVTFYIAAVLKIHFVPYRLSVTTGPQDKL